IRGQMRGSGPPPRLKAEAADGSPLIDQSSPPGEVADVATALAVAGAWLRQTQNLEPVAVGHRVVHGGPQYNRPVVVDRTVLADLERYVSLAPLHQPNNLAPIRSILARSPDLPQLACFDPPFHPPHHPLTYTYPLPQHL